MSETCKRKKNKTVRLFLKCLGPAIAVLALSGCTLFHLHRSPVPARVEAIQLTTNSTPAVTIEALQIQVMRFADSYVAAIAQAADEFGSRAGTPQAQLAALRWKLGQATSAYTDATGPNPVVNALDILVLVTVSRMVTEDYGVKTFGDAIEPQLEVERQQETNVWLFANSFLKRQQQQELRNMVEEWRQKNPHQRYVGSLRFREFAADIGKTPSQPAAPTSIFSLLYLDPLAGLDPTAAAIEETRRLGERVMYYTQRMPMLLSWQTEALIYELAGQPESKQVLSNADELATSAELFAKTSQQLPQLIRDQRRAAIQQVLDGLRSQETDMRQTLNAGGNAATAINGAIQSLDQFVHYVSSSNPTSTATSTNRRPFNVLDYGTAAGQIGAAARDLNNLLATVNQSAPRLARVGQQTTADARAMMNRAFWLGVALILIFLIGLLAVALAYRVLANRLTANRRGPPNPAPGAS